jgi:hypothetical protein
VIANYPKKSSIIAAPFCLNFPLVITEFRCSMSIYYNLDDRRQGILQKDVRNVGFQCFYSATITSSPISKEHGQKQHFHDQ